MTECEKLAVCPFFNDQMANMPAVASLMKQTFCRGNKMQCARYRLVLAGLPVPKDLLPNDRERAEQLLAGY